jgi:polyisoprenyl-phosphate glycosyltransferase
MKKISIISPVYGAEKILPDLVREIEKVVSKITDSYEIILVEDHSPDNSWLIIKDLAINNKNIVGIHFSRNFGQQEAIHAGLKYATGDYVITLDCDLQDNPVEILQMIDKADKGYDIVLAARMDRKDDFFKKMFSQIFYKVLNYLSEIKINPDVANFVLYKKQVVDALLSMGDYFVYYPYMVNWVGFKKYILPVQHNSRKDDKRSSYSFKKRMRLAYMTIISFSDRPLRIVLKLGLIIVLFSILFAMILIVSYIRGSIQVPGWMSIFVSIWFLGGLLISVLGMIGIYIGNIFATVKNRPSFIINETVNTNL